MKSLMMAQLSSEGPPSKPAALPNSLSSLLPAIGAPSFTSWLFPNLSLPTGSRTVALLRHLIEGTRSLLEKAKVSLAKSKRSPPFPPPIGHRRRAVRRPSITRGILN